MREFRWIMGDEGLHLIRHWLFGVFVPATYAVSIPPVIAHTVVLVDYDGLKAK